VGNRDRPDPLPGQHGCGLTRSHGKLDNQNNDRPSRVTGEAHVSYRQSHHRPLDRHRRGGDDTRRDCLAGAGAGLAGAANQADDRRGAWRGTDIIARIVADPLARQLGQAVVIENRPGAGTTLASELVSKSEPDGYSTVLMSAGHAVAAAIYKTLRYDSVTDFQAASLVAAIPLVLITRNDSPIKDVKTLIERARAKPDELSYGTGGVGTTMHLSAELLRQIEGIKLRHIPHRTAPQLVQALEAGDVDLVFETMPAVLGQIQAGTRRAIAVTTRARFPGLPNVPTLAESGVRDFDVHPGMPWRSRPGPRRPLSTG
jgi:tripartite-type tricarboxylate transporter receptor subunit TctC